VVSDVRNAGPIQDPQPEMYSLYAQVDPGSAWFGLMIRTRGGDPTSIVPAVRAAIRSVDPTAALSDVGPMQDVMAKTMGRPRFYFSLLGTFAALALVLAMAGLYGVLTYAVAQRTREIGIRAALGSSRGQLVGLVGGEGMRLVLLGVVVGLAAGAAVTRLMVSMLFGVSPLDPIIWTSAAVLIVVVGAIASVLPAERAARVDPAIAMQTE
jgi:putative ABC transport system permease protein